MTCAFDLAHYRELLEAARVGGYKFGRFEGDPRPGFVYLRHDVDLSLEAALRLAELEADEGVVATYFLMSESVFYNLASPEGTRTISGLLELGHNVGAHARWPVIPEIDEELFVRVLAWHNPDPEYMDRPVEGFLNVMAKPWFAPGSYRSDSNQQWRSGCPHDDLPDGRFDWLQLLVHPEIWVYPGETMRETMLAFLAADREQRLAHLAEDRIDLS